MRYRELTIGIGIAVTLLLVFVFRGKIFNTAPPLLQENRVQTEQQTPHMQATTTAPKPQPALTYHGRKLDEVRISPETAASLSAQQKNKVSADIHAYAKMVQDTPEYIAAWLQLAIVKKGIGDYVGARDIWVYVTLLRPHEATAFLNLGDLSTNYLKDYPKAEANYRAAIQADPKVVMGYLGLSDLYIYFYTEKGTQAEAVLKEGIAANPNDVNLQKALARLYERNAK